MNNITAIPAAKTVPPIRFSLMKIDNIGCIRPNPVRRKTSEISNKKIVLFINYFRDPITKRYLLNFIIVTFPKVITSNQIIVN